MHKSNVLQSRIDALLNVLSEDVLVLSQTGAIIFSSHSNSSLPWGGDDALLGKNLADIFPDSITESLQGMIDQALSHNKVLTKEILLDPAHIPYLRDQGMKDTCWVEARLAPSAGDEPSVVCRIEDISQRKKSERERSRVHRDLLTGMYNKQALMPVLAQSMAQAQRYDWICSLMIISVDNLQDINDKYGWDAGDEILKAMAVSLNQMKRTADFLARVGEDDFAILLPETNEAQGVLAADRVKKMAAELAQDAEVSSVPFTLSVGVATLNDEDDSAEVMYARADNYLREAKALGDSIIGDLES